MAGYAFTRLRSPARTVARRDGRVVATLTDGARTAVLAGPRRVFAEPRTTSARVVSTSWVRYLPRPWQAGGERSPWFASWLPQALGNRSPDVLASSLQYVSGSPSRRNGSGTRYAGDASFGQKNSDGTTGARDEGGDFYDYLGVRWTFPGGLRRAPDKGRYNTVDCSGYLRLVIGYRSGYPLSGDESTRYGLPRRAINMARQGPGVTVVANRGGRPRGFGALAPGDLVLFNNDPKDGPQVDHVGIYLGVDTEGHHRFVSSRKVADGPTMGDVGGASRLDGPGYYPDAFRQVRRI